MGEKWSKKWQKSVEERMVKILVAGIEKKVVKKGTEKRLSKWVKSGGPFICYFVCHHLIIFESQNLCTLKFDSLLNLASENRGRNFNRWNAFSDFWRTFLKMRFDIFCKFAWARKFQKFWQKRIFLLLRPAFLPNMHI